jgi:double-stranded uracil-DNA glycosylase
VSAGGPAPEAHDEARGAIVPWRPTREQQQAARGRTVPDVAAPGLRVLFCGINPGLYSGAVGHHFARPGNRFWKALAASGFTDRVLSPFEERELLRFGLGITNLVEVATARADELSADQLRTGAEAFRLRAAGLAPAFVAILGVGAYRTAFDRPRASMGPQEETIGPALLWVLPNPSGLNASFQLPELARTFGELRAVAISPGRRDAGPTPAAAKGRPARRG